MWWWPGCPDAKQALPGSPAVHLNDHAGWDTVQDLTAAMTVTATTAWLVLRSCYKTKPPHQITMKKTWNRALRAPPSTHYFTTVKSQGRQTRGARPAGHLRWPHQLDQFRQEPTMLLLHPDLCPFGATMTCKVSLSSHHLQPIKAFLGLMTKRAPECGVAPRCPKSKWKWVVFIFVSTWLTLLFFWWCAYTSPLI